MNTYFTIKDTILFWNIIIISVQTYGIYYGVKCIVIIFLCIHTWDAIWIFLILYDVNIGKCYFLKNHFYIFIVAQRMGFNLTLMLLKLHSDIVINIYLIDLKIYKLKQN